jgi:hypothetical protein
MTTIGRNGNGATEEEQDLDAFKGLPGVERDARVYQFVRSIRASDLEKYEFQGRLLAAVEANTAATNRGTTAAEVLAEALLGKKPTGRPKSEPPPPPPARGPMPSGIDISDEDTTQIREYKKDLGPKLAAWAQEQEQQRAQWLEQHKQWVETQAVKRAIWRWIKGTGVVLGVLIAAASVAGGCVAVLRALAASKSTPTLSAPEH